MGSGMGSDSGIIIIVSGMVSGNISKIKDSDPKVMIGSSIII
jgi:hypothetical protein